MTLPQIIRTFGWGVVIVMAPVAAWVAVTDVGRPYGQPPSPSKDIS